MSQDAIVQIGVLLGIYAALYAAAQVLSSRRGTRLSAATRRYATFQGFEFLGSVRGIEGQFPCMAWPDAHLNDAIARSSRGSRTICGNVFMRQQRRVVRGATVAILESGALPLCSVRPRTVDPNDLTGTAPWSIEMESEAFNRAYVVEAEDRRFAHGLVDQHMIAWLLETQQPYTFETGPGGVLVAMPPTDPEGYPELLTALDAFVSSLPSSLGSQFRLTPMESVRVATESAQEIRRRRMGKPTIVFWMVATGFLVLSIPYLDTTAPLVLGVAAMVGLAYLANWWKQR